MLLYYVNIMILFIGFIMFLIIWFNIMVEKYSLLVHYQNYQGLLCSIPLIHDFYYTILSVFYDVLLSPTTLLPSVSKLTHY